MDSSSHLILPCLYVFVYTEVFSFFFSLFFFFSFFTYVRSFWEQFQIVLNAGCSNATSVTLDENIVLFGHDIHFKLDSTFDLIILQAKFFIYKCKINKTIPQLHSFKRYL